MGIVQLSGARVQLHQCWNDRVQQGTLPFMSMPLLDAWDLERPSLHTAVDDFESFLWVLVWSLVYIYKRFATTTN